MYFGQTDDPGIEKLTDELLEPAFKEMARKHEVDVEIFRDFVRDAILEILNHTGGKIEGVRVLDLGCGSDPQLDDCCPREHEPWLCRILLFLNAKPIGVDLGNLENEDFEGHQLDLMKEGSLVEIPDRSIDIAHNRKLVASPTFMGRYGYMGIDWLYELLEPQLERILEDGAVFLLNDST